MFHQQVYRHRHSALYVAVTPPSNAEALTVITEAQQTVTAQDLRDTRHDSKRVDTQVARDDDGDDASMMAATASCEQQHTHPFEGGKCGNVARGVNSGQ